MTFMPWLMRPFCSLVVASPGATFEGELHSIAHEVFSRINAHGLQKGSVETSHTNSKHCFGLEVDEELNYQLLRDNITAIANQEG